MGAGSTEMIAWRPLQWMVDAFFGAGMTPPRAIVEHIVPIRLGPLVLEVMIEEMRVGAGEVGGNNRGPDLDRYRRGGSGGAWCAALISYAYEVVCDRHGMQMPFARSRGAKRLFARIAAAGEIVPLVISGPAADISIPEPGDTVAWHRGRSGGRWNWTGHIGIVSRVSVGAGRYWSIEGNVGPYPARVREYRHDLIDDRRVGFARI